MVQEFVNAVMAMCFSADVLLRSVFIVCLLVGATGSSAAEDVQGFRGNDAEIFYSSPWGLVGLKYGVDPSLLYSVAFQESARSTGGGRAAPWPWTVRCDARSGFYPDKASALRAIEDCEGSLDVGLFQISTYWHSTRFGSASDLLDPTYNMSVGAQILIEALESSPDDPVLGVGRFHSWRPERAREYGESVWGFFSRLVNWRLRREESDA